MRPFELLIVITILGYLFWVSFGNGTPKDLFRWSPFVAAALVVLHSFVEGARWQMAAVYLLLSIVLLLYPWFRSRSFRLRLSHLAVIWSLTPILLGTTAITGGILWPVFSFVPLTGPYRVGTRSVHLVDKGRMDPYSPSGQEAREVMVQMWYPAETTRGLEPAHYRDGFYSDYRDSSLALVRTRSFGNAAVATTQGSYPLLLFSGPIERFQNTFEMEDLASHGFIIAAVDHSYDSHFVIFPDGRRILASKEFGLLDFTSAAELAISRRRMERRLAIRMADIEFVLNQIVRWDRADSASPFYQRIDLEHIAMLGHSFGGAVAAEICRMDPRVRAGVNMDGSIFGNAKTAGVPKPFFFMFDDTPRPTQAELNLPRDDQARREARELAGDYQDVDRSMDRYGGYFLLIHGLAHMNYTDYALHSQLKAWTGAGSIDIRRAHEMIDRVTLAFLRRELLRDPRASVEAVLRDYPETFFRRQAAPLHSLSQKEAPVPDLSISAVSDRSGENGGGLQEFFPHHPLF